MPPPSMPAVLLLTVLSVSVAPPRLKMPPPNAPALLPLTVLSDTARFGSLGVRLGGQAGSPAVGGVEIVGGRAVPLSQCREGAIRGRFE